MRENRSRDFWPSYPPATPLIFVSLVFAVFCGVWILCVAKRWPLYAPFAAFCRVCLDQGWPQCPGNSFALGTVPRRCQAQPIVTGPLPRNSSALGTRPRRLSSPKQVYPINVHLSTVHKITFRLSNTHTQTLELALRAYPANLTKLCENQHCCGLAG